MSANNLQTNRNANRFFFATAENGEQVLGLQFGTTGGSPNLSTMSVTISGAGGNGVVVNTAPSFQATEYVFAEQGMGVYGSTYFTPSTLTTAITGVNLSSDRVPATGVACIESYAGNGALGGFEFLSRGVDSALISTPQEAFLSTIGAPGATAVLTKDGNFVVNTTLTSAILTNQVSTGVIQGYSYPQPLLSTIFQFTQGGTVDSNTPTVLFTHTDANTSNMIAGNNYLVDVPGNILVGSVGGGGTYLDIGVRLGGNGTFNYTTSLFIPAGGTPPSGVSCGFVQIADMGNSTKDIDIIGYLHDATASISTSTNIGGDIAYMKNIT